MRTDGRSRRLWRTDARLRAGTPVVRRLGRGGFTLLEVMTALFILAIAITSVYYSLQMSIAALDSGKKSIADHQNVRVGLNILLNDLRRAVSPQSTWNNLPKIETITEAEETEETEKERREREKESVLIRFIGRRDEASWVVEDTPKRGGKLFDVYAVSYAVDRDDSALYKEIRGSVVDARFEQMREEFLEKSIEKKSDSGNETAFRTDYDFVAEFRDADADRVLIAQRIIQVNFQYFDGYRWWDRWDSEEYVDEIEGHEEEVEQYDADGNPLLEDDGFREKMGLPDAVLVELRMAGGQVISGIAEIPARDFDLMIVSADGFYREGRTVLDYNRKHKQRPRKAQDGQGQRIDAWDNDRLEPYAVRLSEEEIGGPRGRDSSFWEEDRRERRSTRRSGWRRQGRSDFAKNRPGGAGIDWETESRERRPAADGILERERRR